MVTAVNYNYIFCELYDTSFDRYKSILTLSFLDTNKQVLLANSEDPDKMPPYAAFHQGLHCFKSVCEDKNNLQGQKNIIL